MAGEDVAFRRSDVAAAGFLMPAIQSNYTTTQRVAAPEDPLEEREPAKYPFLHALGCPRDTLPNGGGGRPPRHLSGASLEERRGRGFPTSRLGPLPSGRWGVEGTRGQERRGEPV